MRRSDWHHPDDDELSRVDEEASAQDSRSSTQPLIELVTDDHFARSTADRPAESWLHRQHAEEFRRDGGAAQAVGLVTDHDHRGAWFVPRDGFERVRLALPDLEGRE